MILILNPTPAKLFETSVSVAKRLKTVPGDRVAGNLEANTGHR